MRWLAVVVAVTGCGRIAFDPRGDASGDTSGPDAFVCPPGYTFDTGSCYRNGGTSLDWLSAEAACEADALGAHLAVIGDAGEAAVVARYLTTVNDLAWVGASDIASEGMYKTVFNMSPSYLAWSTGEPGGLTQDCVLLKGTFDYADFDCANPDDFICEYDGKLPNPLGWAACPPGYTLMDGSCYRFVDGSAQTDDWFAAEAKCEADRPGSHLVVIGSMLEAQNVDTLVPSNILDHFIGASDLVTEATYLDVFGQPIAFTTFEAAEPDGGTNQNCLLLTDAVQLKDADCNAGDDYVCEYDGLMPVPASWGQ